MSNLEEEVLSPIDETRISEYFSEWYREETAPEEVEDAEEEDVVEEEGGDVISSCCGVGDVMSGID